MTDKPTCDVCGKPIPDTAYVCTRCAEVLKDALELVAKLAGEAMTTIAKQDRIGDGGTSEPDSDPWDKHPNALYPTPLPYDPDAARAHDAAVSTVVTWARHVSEERGIALPLVGTDEHPTAAVATWLTGHLDWLRHRQEAAESFRELLQACRVLERVVDRPAARWWAGRCDVDDCTEDLYPVAGASSHTCRCGVEHDLGERKDWFLKRAEDHWDNAARLAGLLTSLGVVVTAESIRGYAHRGRLAPHPDLDPKGWPRYRLGSVRELVLAQHAEQRERTLRAAVKAAELADKRARKAKENAA